MKFRRYERTCWEVLSDRVKIAVVQRSIEYDDLRRHLLMHATLLLTYPLVREENRSIIMAGDTLTGRGADGRQHCVQGQGQRQGGRSVRTLICCTHIFLRTARSLRTSHIFMRVTYTHGSSVCEKVCAHVSRFSPSPSRLLLSHVSPILAVPARSLRDHSRLRLH